MVCGPFPSFHDPFYYFLALLGHLGDTTVEHVAHHLPIIIGDALRKLFDDLPYPNRVAPTLISDLLSRCIVALDASIAGDVLSLFPGGLQGLSSLSDQYIQSIINDQFEGGQNFNKARLSMYGTTALVTLVDPEHENVWVANVGDCQAGTS
jgi:pyruvate dehydrogenase phosphatase